ncbi:MAG TPA: HPF/RaiA family ribosome-associated protein, partial [Pseudolabrys sp.]|nr:HPF/RaiA family ribosome-associated protein [Pseudolabrys sp.]
MQIQPEISFHNCDRSAAIEDAIQEHIERLERIFGHLTTCKVRVDQRNQNQNETIPPVVRIEITVPGHKEIVVAHEPDHLQRKYQAPELSNA